MKESPDYIVNFSNRPLKYHLYTLGDENTLYGTFVALNAEDAEVHRGIFIGHRTLKGDYHWYIDIKIMDVDFDISQRAETVQLNFQYPKGLDLFGKEKVSGYAHLPGCTPLLCTIEKISSPR